MHFLKTYSVNEILWKCLFLKSCNKRGRQSLNATGKLNLLHGLTLQRQRISAITYYFVIIIIMVIMSKIKLITTIIIELIAKGPKGPLFLPWKVK